MVCRVNVTCHLPRGSHQADLFLGDERPCTRCIKRGLQDACQDGVRKKAKYLHDAPNEALMPGVGATLYTHPQARKQNSSASSHNGSPEQQRQPSQTSHHNSSFRQPAFQSVSTPEPDASINDAGPDHEHIELPTTISSGAQFRPEYSSPNAEPSNQSRSNKFNDHIAMGLACLGRFSTSNRC